MLITIPLKRTYLVFSTCNRFLHVYLSRNATPWHHSRVSLWGRRRYNRYAAHVGDDGCCCESCTPNAPVKRDTPSAQVACSACFGRGYTYGPTNVYPSTEAREEPETIDCPICRGTGKKSNAPVRRGGAGCSAIQSKGGGK